MRQLFTILCLTTALIAQADPGPPSIQAVCKVTTSDGKTYEGFIILINGGLDGIHPNGFYLYQDDRYNWKVLFDYEFNKLEKIGTNKYQIGGFVPDAKELYFLAYTWDTDKHWLTEELKKTQERSGQYLIAKTIIQRKYLMLDTLPLFTELPNHLHLDYSDKKLRRYSIPMKDIVSLEMVLQPNEKLSAEIEKKRKIFGELDPTGEFLEPSWVHELVNKPELLKQLKEEFKEWYRK